MDVSVDSRVSSLDRRGGHTGDALESEVASAPQAHDLSRRQPSLVLAHSSTVCRNWGWIAVIQPIYPVFHYSRRNPQMFRSVGAGFPRLIRVLATAAIAATAIVANTAPD